MTKNRTEGPIRKEIFFRLFYFFRIIQTGLKAQFATETKLKGEKNSITELCYTPGNPRNFQIGISFKF